MVQDCRLLTVLEMTQVSHPRQLNLKCPADCPRNTFYLKQQNIRRATAGYKQVGEKLMTLTSDVLNGAN